MMNNDRNYNCMEMIDSFAMNSEFQWTFAFNERRRVLHIKIR